MTPGDIQEQAKAFGHPTSYAGKERSRLGHPTHDNIEFEFTLIFRTFTIRMTMILRFQKASAGGRSMHQLISSKIKITIINFIYQLFLVRGLP